MDKERQDANSLLPLWQRIIFFLFKRMFIVQAVALGMGVVGGLMVWACFLLGEKCGPLGLVAALLLLLFIPVSLIGGTIAFVSAFLGPGQVGRDEFKRRYWYLFSLGGMAFLFYLCMAHIVYGITMCHDLSYDKTFSSRASAFWGISLRYGSIFDYWNFTRKMPPEARQIHIQGETGNVLGQGGICKWSCLVTEREFMDWAQDKGFVLATNQFFNVDEDCPEAERRGTDRMGCLPTDVPHPSSFISYTSRAKDGGGIVLVFDRDAGRLLGGSSSN